MNPLVRPPGRTALAAAALIIAHTAHAGFADRLELYYSFDAPTLLGGNTLTDLHTADGNADNAARGALSVFSAGAKFGDALDVSTIARTPRATISNAAEINAGWLPGTGDYSLAFWYRQSAGSANRIWSAGARANDANNDDGLMLAVTDAGQFTAALHDPAASSTTRDTFTTTNNGAVLDGVTWNHFALVRTGDSLRLWINGADTAGLALKPNANIAVNTATWFRQPNFGPDQDTVTRAAYDDTAIWKRALTAAEVAQIYNGGTGATIASLTAVPEPSTYGLTVAGAFVASAVFRRRRRAA